MAVWAVEHAYQVALRKESVDRNGVIVHIIGHIYTSLSARRAWIEMSSMSERLYSESGRSPQGERG